MAETYTKLFASITRSTVWQEPAGTRLTWVTMLAESDQNGDVFASVPGLARLANVTVDECEAALRTFLAPDPYSRTRDHEGRRIEEIDGGWRLLNHAKFHAIGSQISRRTYKREWDRTERKPRHKPDKSDTNPTKPDKSDAPDHTRLNKEQDQKKKQPQAALPVPPEWVDRSAWDGFVTMRARERHPLTERAAILIIRKLEAFHKAGHDPNAALDQSTRQGWRDVFEPKAGTKQVNGHSAATNFRGKSYKGTPVHELPLELRPDDAD